MYQKMVNNISGLGNLPFRNKTPKPKDIDQDKKQFHQLELVKEYDPHTATKLPLIFPTPRCRLKMLRMDIIQNYLLLEVECIKNPEIIKPRDDKSIDYFIRKIQIEQMNQEDDRQLQMVHQKKCYDMVSVMKLEKAPTETYADVGGLEQQILEIKESVKVPLTHPELYEQMGIHPPKGVILYGLLEQEKHYQQLIKHLLHFYTSQVLN